jgi:hypothetical protein
MCAISVEGQRYRILCALKGMQYSPKCAVNMTLQPESTLLTTTEFDIRTSGPVLTSESTNSFDFRY